MDRPLNTSEKNDSIRRKLAIGVVLGLLIIAGMIYVYRMFQPTIKTQDFTIAQVERGDVLQTLTASGTVIPALEYIINAPVVTEIKKIYLSNGAEVKRGDKILELDQEYTALEYEKLRDELRLRQNNIEKLKLQFDKELIDLDNQFKIKGLQIDEMDAQINSQVRLQKVGGAAVEDIEKAKLQLAVLGIEKDMLHSDLSFKKRLNVIEKNNLELEYEIQTKRLSELKRKLSETTVKSEMNGVITWINEDLGKTVQVGEPLVRIADLNKFRVEALTSDRNMPFLKVGTPVMVRVNRKDLSGKITHTLPTIENNTIKFHVALDRPDDDVLRPNQRVDVYIITAESYNTLRLKNGPANTVSAKQDMYVVRGHEAIKVQVTKGLTNPDFVEILEGLVEGDRVLVSDMKKYNEVNTIQLK